MKKILLIEDNPDLRENTAEILELSNYKVTVAENGKAGLKAALQNKPDLIICDIMMPELDGYGVLSAIQNNEDLKNIPFIFLTAKTERAEVRRGMESGAGDYITKPFTGTELLNAVECRLKISNRNKEVLKNYGSEHTEEENTEAILSEFVQNRNSNKYAKKQAVYTEGNHPNRIYYVVKGKIKIYKSNDDGKELITGLYGPGDFFGYTALLEGSSYKESAQTLEETELAVIPKEEFESLLHREPAVASKFMLLLASNVAEMEKDLVSMAYNSLRKKVAHAILKLHSTYNEKKEMPFAMQISRENLASIAGTAKESLIRTLSEFRNEKIIDIREGQITVLDIKKLEQMPN